MRRHIHLLMSILAIAFVLAGTLANAGPQWAVATSYTGVYLLNYDSGVLTNTMDTGLSGGSLGGVAIWNNYVFVADGTSGTGSLHVGKINNKGLVPQITWMEKAVPLGNLKDPSSVAVDATGGVYVISRTRTTDVSGTHSYIGYLPSQGNTWSSAGLNLFDIPTGFLADIATTGTGSQAVIAHQDSRDPEDHWAGQSWISSVSSAGVGNTVLPEDKGYDPRAVVVGANGLAYMVNHSIEIDNSGALPWGSISVLNSGTLGNAAALAIGTGKFRPTDVSYFSIAGTNYLGVVGTTDGGANQAWRIPLDPTTGLPLVNIDADGNLSDSSIMTEALGISNEVFCTLSPDGSTFWVTNTESGTVTALDTSTWQGTDLSVIGGPRYIAGFTPTEAVPEPSSLLALLTGSIGLIGFLKRRR